MEPVSADNPNPGTPTAKIPALIQTKGAEIGVRTLIVPNLQSTVSLWYLHSDSELEQDGDTGGTVASQQPSNRYGVEWANYYTLTKHLALDFDAADSIARFTSVDPRMTPRPGRSRRHARARSGRGGDFVGHHAA